ncbi:tigger transposable element-derived protein 1-like [Homarus americanus]|uniref:tigger transposable element-derived protein 1-like n=1 Tax=Homarus americanus TaxID=6706 RepID=UPI001C44A71D|nr:tigger transposable element-derived protein 1-like [Homarus americanus]
MSGKRPSASSGEPKHKKARKTIVMDIKLDVVTCLQSGERVSDVGHVLGLNESTVRTIRDNAEKIKNSALSGTSASATKTSYVRCSIMEHMERKRTGSMWIEDQNHRNIPVSMLLVQAKARAIYEELQKDEEGPVKPFSASSGWFGNLKRRYGYHNIKVSGETASADVLASEQFVWTLKDIIEEGGYSAKQIFNLDETTLFWKRMPTQTFISREEKAAPGFKASKDRYTVLVLKVNLCKTRENIVGLGKKVGLEEVELKDVQELLDSHKEELSPQDLLVLEKQWEEEEETEKKEEPKVVRTLTAKRLTKAFT